MNIWQFRAVLNFDFETLHTASIDCIKQRFHVPNRWHFSPLQIGEHVPRRPNFRTRINMACIRKVGHTSRYISPLCSRLTVYGKHTDPAKSTTLNTSKQATSQPINQPTHPPVETVTILKRRRREREEKIDDGRIYSNDVCHFDSIDRWLKVKPSSSTPSSEEEGHARLMLDQIYSVIEHSVFPTSPRMLFQLSKDVDL